MLKFQPRPSQEVILQYQGGKMGVSAVPGSGKTWTLSYLAAHLIANDGMRDEQEILIVTLVNAAVRNFASRIGEFVEAMGLIPNLGYRVRTLHGLAHDIVRERPALAGLSDEFQIIDEYTAREILKDTAINWLRQHPYALETYLSADLDERKTAWVQRDKLPNLVTTLATNFIKRAKDLSITPPMLKMKLERFGDELPLLEMGLDIYTDYQRALNYRGMVDFDDLVRLAIQALNLDRPFLERLRARWPYILEDEAQDSSRLQQDILQLLAGPEGNWVRVGDPNQAIYESFTTANPRYLLDFLDESSVQDRELPESGRSSRRIIGLANYLIDWTREEHVIPQLRASLTTPHIHPVAANDPQPNPTDEASRIYISTRKFTPNEELEEIAKSLARWVPKHRDETVAVLVPRNTRGFRLSKALKARDIDVVEHLRSTASTRETAGALGNILNYLADPTSRHRLARVYEVWRRDERDEPAAQPRLKWVVDKLRACAHVEDFLWPRIEEDDWLASLEVPATLPDLEAHLIEFRDLVRRWQAATLLPIDQLILTLAQDLFTRPDDLAVAHKLAVVLRGAADMHPEWHLPELTQELAEVARNERKFLGLSDDDLGFNPQAHKGKVVITTMHKAKGLEWDRVYLMSVNNYDFPSAQPYDHFIAEPWYIRDKLNLQAEILAQLEALQEDPEMFIYDEGQASQKARLEYASERLRLLYVGITRARKELIITWNSGQRGDCQPAIPLLALQSFWEVHLDEG